MIRLNSSFRFSNLTCDGEVEPTKNIQKSDFKVFYRVISCHFIRVPSWPPFEDMGGSSANCGSGSGMSERSRAQCGEVVQNRWQLHVDIWKPSTWTSFVLWWIWFVFIVNFALAFSEFELFGLGFRPLDWMSLDGPLEFPQNEHQNPNRTTKY